MKGKRFQAVMGLKYYYHEYLKVPFTLRWPVWRQINVYIHATYINNWHD